MAVKEDAKRIIDALPEETTMDQIIHALYIQTKFDRGEGQIRSGQGIAHADAKRRLNKWAK